jgi:hypothetical protein
VARGAGLPSTRQTIEAAKDCGSDEPRAVVLNKHCPVCDFQSRCRDIAINREDLSLLGAMTEKERAKCSERGISTITQLSYGYRPRRRKGLDVIHITKHHKLLVGIEKFQLLNASIIRGDEPIANIASIAHIRDENAIRQVVGTLLRRGDAVPYSRHDHGPAIDAGGDQFAGVESKLAIMQILLVFRREFAIEGDGQSDRFGHLRARIRKRRGGENDAHRKARANFKERTSFADHGGEQFFP